MNIDIVNKDVSKKLNIDEKEIEAVNKFYWRKVYDHFYSYNPNPINIIDLCVFYPDKYIIKNRILDIIKRIRIVRDSPKYKKISAIRDRTLDAYYKELNGLLKIRHHNKYTN